MRDESPVFSLTLRANYKKKKGGKKVERSINNPLKSLQYCILE